MVTTLRKSARLAGLATAAICAPRFAVFDDPTPEDNKTIARAIMDQHNMLKGEWPKYVTRVDDMLKRMGGDASKLDLKGISDELEKIKSGYDLIVRMVRNNSGSPMYIPGLEDEAERFSLVRACFGVKTGKWDNSGFEKKVFEESRTRIKNVIGVESEGGYFVPDQVLADVIGAIYVRSVLIAAEGAAPGSVTRISVIDGLFGQTVRIPKFRGGMVAYFIGENDSYVESALKVGDMSLSPRKLTLLTRLSEEMRMFGGFGIDGLMRQDMSRAAAKKIDYTALYGNALENSPRGLVLQKNITQYSAENGTTTAPTDAVGGELTFDGLQEMQGQIEDNNLDIDASAALISAPRYFRRLKRQKVSFYSGQTTEKAFVLGAPLLTDARLREYTGDFGKTTQMPTANKPGQSLGWTSTAGASKFGDVVFGNWSEMIMGRWGATEIVDDQGIGQGFTKDQTLIKMRMFMDFGIRHEGAFVWCPDAKMRD